MTRKTPTFLEPSELAARVDDPQLCVVDLSSWDNYLQGHVPEAVNLDVAALQTSEPPVMGLMPGTDALCRVLAEVGIAPDTHIVAYDDANGPKAGRLLYTLAVLGHERVSVLDGGLVAWREEGNLIERQAEVPRGASYAAKASSDVVATRGYILDHLKDPDVVLLDVRSPDEYAGRDLRASRGGHIPGAINVEWNRTLDYNRNLRLRPAAELRAMFEAAGITPDREIVTYCQSHMRSSHTFAVLRALGYTRLRGYPGSWSDWGNNPDTPVES
ncbi:MAG TPA: sulfurtransferase [Gammaproteobacteria bacterium]|nr:sulfurtransferase [Gammaproteobacteria bacterium]